MDKVYNISFGSKVNPIKPFTVLTKEGKMYFSEVNIDKAINPKLMTKMNRFFLKNISAATESQLYNKYKTGTLKERKETENEFEKYFLEIFNNKKIKDNITLLLAKNNKNRICGMCLSYPYLNMPDCTEDTLYIDSIAVNKKYRRTNIATKLLETVLNANKNSFTDAFLMGNVCAKNFFRKNGFSSLNKENQEEKFISEYLDSNYDINHVIPFTKPLQTDNPRWYEKFKQWW